MKLALKNKLKQMANDPKAQLVQLATGTFISLLAMLGLFLSSDLEMTWLFYLLSIVLVTGVGYAIPGYIGVWVWRMKDTIFRHE